MIIVLGIAGSGKSTQCELLADTGDYQWLPVGQLLRDNITDENLRKIIESGEVLDDDIVIPMVEKVLAEKGDEPELIIDGFPRTLRQANHLLGLRAEGLLALRKAVHLKVSEETALERLLKRGRTDDHESAIGERFQEYKDTVLPILKLLQEAGLKVYEIDGEKAPEEVHREIVASLQ